MNRKTRMIIAVIVTVILAVTATTVWAGSNLVLYVENKVTESQAKHLLEKMIHYGDSGFELDAFDKGNDGLRKAKYLFRYDSHPQYFALSVASSWLRSRHA